METKKTVVELKKEFTFKKQKFIQLEKNANYYIYRVEIDSDDVHFEVFERRYASDCIDFTKKIFSETNFHEVIPKDNDFGVWGWCYKTQEKAFEKFENLEK